MNNLIEKLKANVFTIESISELKSIYDVVDIFTSEYYISSGDLECIIDDMFYCDLDINTLIDRTTNDGFGASFYELYYLKNEDMYVLINNLV